jgi:hypothetical protein
MGSRSHAKLRPETQYLFQELAPVAVSPKTIEAVYAHWRTYHPRSYPLPRSSQKEWRQIVARLQEGYLADDLCQAIDGMHRSPWHLGENPGGKKYLSLELCLRTASQVEKFRELAEQPQGPVLTEKNSRSVRALQEWAGSGEGRLEG